jgi:hypothetical protein
LIRFPGPVRVANEQPDRRRKKTARRQPEKQVHAPWRTKCLFVGLHEEDILLDETF